MYTEMRTSLEKNMGLDFIGIGKGDLNMRCQDAIDIVSTGEENKTHLMNEFMEFVITTECSLDGQMKGIYPNLSEVLVKFYRAPSSTSGVERNHKVGNRVLTQTRTRLTVLSVQKQVAIQHNNTQVKRKYCLLYTSPSPRDQRGSRMPSSA